MSDTLVAVTSRPVVFSHNGRTERRPAGTEVYVREPRRPGDYWRIRIPGTLLTQDVKHNAIRVP